MLANECMASICMYAYGVLGDTIHDDACLSQCVWLCLRVSASTHMRECMSHHTYIHIFATPACAVNQEIQDSIGVYIYMHICTQQMGWLHFLSIHAYIYSVYLHHKWVTFGKYKYIHTHANVYTYLHSLSIHIHK